MLCRRWRAVLARTSSHACCPSRPSSEIEEIQKVENCGKRNKNRNKNMKKIRRNCKITVEHNQMNHFLCCTWGFLTFPCPVGPSFVFVPNVISFDICHYSLAVRSAAVAAQAAAGLESLDFSCFPRDIL